MLCAATITMRAQSPAPASAPTAAAVPRDPVAAIKEAFETHQLVAIGDNHGNEQVHDLRLTLMAGDLPHFVDAMREMYAGNKVGYDHFSYDWPRDIRDHGRRLAWPNESGS